MTGNRQTDHVVSKLQSIPWDFSEARTNTGPHRIHPYPARFIPQIPAALIDLFYPGNDAAVLDPFCGSGTTLVAALERGIRSVGIDVNPLATLIAKVKTTPLHNSIRQLASDVSGRAKTNIEQGIVRIPSIPRLDHWFQRDIQLALAAVIREIESVNDVDAADALKVALSSIIVRVSNQESDTRYAAIHKDFTQEDLWRAFSRAVDTISLALQNIGGDLFRNDPQVRLITKDIMQVEPADVGEGVGLVITSPPYPNAYEYWLYHKYRMYWLGMDPIAVREAEIGARPHYFKKNHQTEHDFERQMGRCFWLLSKTVRKGCYACFVVGRSVIHGRHIDNEALLERAAFRHGFRKAGSIQRTIARNRKAFNLSHATIDHERIVVFALEQS